MKRYYFEKMSSIMSAVAAHTHPQHALLRSGPMRRALPAVLIALLCLGGLLPALTQPAQIHAARDYGGTMWKLEGKRIYTGETSGSWAVGIRARADGDPGDTISMSSSKSVSNSVSGNVDIPLRTLSAKFQFNVSKQWSASASKSYGLSNKKRGSWWSIQYKRVYKNYKIKARQYSFYDGTWHKTKKTKWIRAKRFNHFAYKLTSSKAPKGGKTQ